MALLAAHQHAVHVGGQGGLGLLWLTGLIMVWSVFGGPQNLPGIFWIKFICVLGVTAVLFAALSVRNPEAARAFLQGLVSNDVAKVTPTQAIYAAFLTDVTPDGAPTPRKSASHPSARSDFSVKSFPSRMPVKISTPIRSIMRTSRATISRGSRYEGIACTNMPPSRLISSVW